MVINLDPQINLKFVCLFLFLKNMVLSKHCFDSASTSAQPMSLEHLFF